MQVLFLTLELDLSLKNEIRKTKQNQQQKAEHWNKIVTLTTFS